MTEILLGRLIRWSIGGLLICGGCAAETASLPSGPTPDLHPGGAQSRALEDEADAHGQRARTLLGKGDLSGAVRELQEAVRAQPNHAALHSHLGKLYRVQGDLRRAEAELRRAVDLDRHDAEARNNLAFVLYDEGETARAVSEWEAAVVSAPDWPGPRAGLALGLLAVGRVNDAMESYRRALRLDAHYADLDYLRRVRFWSPAAAGQAEII